MINKKNIIAWLVVTSVLLSWSAFAASNTDNSNLKTNYKSSVMKNEKWKWWMLKMKCCEWNKWWIWDMKWKWFWELVLTDAEKTALSSMTDAEKKVFFDNKRLELETKRLAKENVIDKLLVWETLTSDEELLKQEIIKERADMKARKKEMDEIKAIMEKVKNWEVLTSDEQSKLDAFKLKMWEKKYK